MTATQPQNRRLGYTHVSTFGQTLDAQLEQLGAAGCTKVYREKVTGARADRRELLRIPDRLGPGDVVTVTRIDSLARSTFDLFGIVKRIVDAKAQFRSLAEPWADSGTSTGRLMLAVLGGLADVERDLIRTRTAEGRSRAKARGQPMGRPHSLTRRSRKRPPGAARRARRYRNWPTATTVASPPCAAPPEPHDEAPRDFLTLSNALEARSMIGSGCQGLQTLRDHACARRSGKRHRD
jgi:DNA invertase Pin-like site-specific DNA recombinase